jgi:hypothetical protein
MKFPQPFGVNDRTVESVSKVRRRDLRDACRLATLQAGKGWME